MPIRRIAITGALGHIGSRLIHQFIPGRFDQVLLIDNLLTQRYCSLFDLPGNVPFRFLQTDILKADLQDILAGCEAVIHLAAITDAANSFSNKDQVEEVNFHGTQLVAQACAAVGARLVFLSTTSVYGTQEAVVDESCGPGELRPQSPYAESKLQAERFLATLTNLRYVICRFGTIYGTSIGMRFHTAINKFCWQACMGEPLTVWRTALQQRRPYLDLGDAVRALGFLLDQDLFDSNVYNVLTENATVSEIVEAIRLHVPKLEVTLVDAAIMNQLSYHVANRKFAARGFVTRGSLAEGIRETLMLLRNSSLTCVS